MKSIDLITVTFNSEAYLRRCFESVRRSRDLFKNYIVIDGGSTDNTIKIIDEFSDIITICISERDDGISDAFNKGIIRCTSDFILLLNSDDWIIDEQILSVLNSISDSDEIICTNMQSYAGENYIGEYSSSPLLISKFNSMLHPGCIISASTYKKIGLYDLSLKVGMDYDFFCRCFKSGVQFRLVDLPLVAFHEGGTSRVRKYQILRESFALRRKYHGAYFPWHEFRQLVSRTVGDALNSIGLKYFVSKALKNYGFKKK
jgi:glycosyltransferase involved in cell wall biosynthesis